MLRREVLYKAYCDGCGRLLSDAEGVPYTFCSLDDPDVGLYASDHGWLEYGGGIYCHQCYDYDDELDEYRPIVSVG